MKFKIGDRIRIINPQPPKMWDFKQGDELIVKYVSSSAVWFKDKKYWAYFDEIELIEDEVYV